MYFGGIGEMGANDQGLCYLPQRYGREMIHPGESFATDLFLSSLGDVLSGGHAAWIAEFVKKAGMTTLIIDYEI